jgi:type VI secretion system protein ImpA
MEKQQITPWLEPLSDDVSGPDLEYDPAFLELEQAANGRPETQFGAAEPPSWPLTREISLNLFERTRDLRVALMWGRAVVNLDGVEGLPAVLALLHGLLENFWDEVHPRPDPDDGDTFARLSVLGSLDTLDGLLGDVRQAQLVMDRRLGGIRVRDVEIALDRLAPRADEDHSTPAQIEGRLGDQPLLAERLRESVESSLASLKALQDLMNDRFGTDNAVDTKNLRVMLTGVQSLLPAQSADGDSGDSEDADMDSDGDDDESPMSNASGGRRAGSGVHSIESRQDAVRAIHLVCAYLERSEPTNPAQLLLRRAERLIDKNFLQLVRDLAPDAVNEVARILGVDPESFGDDT